MTDAAHEAALQAFMADLLNQVKEDSGDGDFVSYTSTIERFDLEGVFDFRRAIAAYEAAQWRPIEKAPRDGTDFLACCAGGKPLIAYFYRGTVVADRGENELIAYPFTHFRPLPPPPEDKG